MKLVKFTVKGHEIAFFCDSRSTRHGFAHDSSMFVDNVPLAEGHCYYLNRTWESWNYQSACLAAVGNEIARYKDWLKDNYKYENGVSRITAKHKEKLDAIYNGNDHIAMLEEIKANLKRNCY